MIKRRHLPWCAVGVLDVDDFLDSIVGSISKVSAELVLFLLCPPSSLLYTLAGKSSLNVMALKALTWDLMVAIFDRTLKVEDLH